MNWTVADSRHLYNLRQWGEGYFDVGADGQLVVRPEARMDSPAIGLADVAAELGEHSLGLPCLLRFPQILGHRVEKLRGAFTGAMQDTGYQGSYTPVYPIKVNQQRRVVEELLRAGAGNVGLEAGSKPELLAVLGLMPLGGTIICNGYKDREYIRLALSGEKLGLRVYLVVEKISELPLILSESRNLGVQPRIGVRARLASAGAGKWQNTGGEKSKFGLSTAHMLELLAQLRQKNALDSLQLLHFHLGSQIPNIQFIKGGMRECGRLYAELRRLGADLQVVDVGGGLGVDYEGTHSRAYCSTNYHMADYAHAIVSALAEVARQENLPEPQIISESGRALTAHHAILLSNVTDVEEAAGEYPLPASSVSALTEDWQRLLQRLDGAQASDALEVYQEAIYLLGEAHQQFNLGLIQIEERARAEEVYARVIWQVRRFLDPHNRAHRDILDELDEKIVDKYFVNFSLFQSLPDVWAIDQIFPIMPIQRLHEEPVRRARIEDITCDSDGRIDAYVTAEGLTPALPVHAVDPDKPYILGVFMVGAYQEILGDMHNLFGDTDSVNVLCDAQGQMLLEQPMTGDTVETVLNYVQFSAPDLLARFQKKVEQSAELNAEQRHLFLQQFADGLHGYTYLE
ncbi:biosynthetic arginine decarboxylase [Acidithiobacillus sp. M4-SHS-6]|uniref:biosynthetic arginine decarboxylase n=1 Tax=Acidithiobacillus sp. M4-SHS-6 TaxID=3383024 RepID=UPI0039BE4773